MFAPVLPRHFSFRFRSAVFSSFFLFVFFFLATKLLCCCFMLIVKDFSAESTKHAMMYGTTHVVHFAP